MAGLTLRETKVVLLAGVLYAAVAIPVGIRRGGDLEVHLPQARLWLEALPLYADPPRVGVWWPPFALVFVAPFALMAQVSTALAKAAWAAGSVACLGWSIAHVPRDRWKSVMLAVAAVAVPLNRNFEDLNINAVLLALLVAAAADLGRGREGRAAAWIGAATALKVFPGLLLVYFVFRRRWSAVAVGIAVAAGFTIATLLPYGVGGAFAGVRDWLANMMSAGWTQLGSNQSLSALASRLHLPPAGLAVLDVACVALAVAALRRPKVVDPAFEELGVVAILAVLLSPIAWVHYFLLALPAWVIALQLPRGGWARGWYTALFVAGIATSGILTVWSLSLRRTVWDLSIYTFGAITLLVVLAFAPRTARVSTRVTRH